jgi:hypothetical protein
MPACVDCIDNVGEGIASDHRMAGDTQASGQRISNFAQAEDRYIAHVVYQSLLLRDRCR